MWLKAITQTNNVPKQVLVRPQQLQGVPVSEQNLQLNDVTDWDVSTARHGFMPKLPNDPNLFINGVGQWVTIPTSSAQLPDNTFYVSPVFDNTAPFFSSIYEMALHIDSLQTERVTVIFYTGDYFADLELNKKCTVFFNDSYYDANLLLHNDFVVYGRHITNITISGTDVTTGTIYCDRIGNITIDAPNASVRIVANRIGQMTITNGTVDIDARYIASFSANSLIRNKINIRFNKIYLLNATGRSYVVADGDEINNVVSDGETVVSITNARIGEAKDNSNAIAVKQCEYLRLMNCYVFAIGFPPIFIRSIGNLWLVNTNIIAQSNIYSIQSQQNPTYIYVRGQSVATTDPTTNVITATPTPLTISSTYASERV